MCSLVFFRYFTDCLDAGADALTLHALMLYHTRAGPFGMSPLFDIMNHGASESVSLLF